MNAMTPEEADSFKEEVVKLLKGLKPAIKGVEVELERQQSHNHDHEWFMIEEFRRFTRAIEALNATLERM